ncbi:MAG: hypothetical protein K8I04_00120 [Gammaproteobacteria bacterium]|nr:hypothetical protein [Gammaproteobacteria bacterium]
MGWWALELARKIDLQAIANYPQQLIFFIVMHRSQSDTFKKVLWVAYLAIALVFVQGVRLHVHTYNHDSATSDHTHQEQAHFDTVGTGQHHPDEVAQIDLSQDGFLKKLPLSSLVIALFAAVIMLLSRRPASQVSWRPDRRILPLSWPFSLRPPLRAPPL